MIEARLQRQTTHPHSGKPAGLSDSERRQLALNFRQLLSEGGANPFVVALTFSVQHGNIDKLARAKEAANG